MTLAILKRLRPAIQGLRAYASARSEIERAALENTVFLDANESPWATPAGPAPESLNRYPDPQPQKLLKRLAQLYEVEENMLLIGRGTDEALDVLFRAFCEARQDEILICPPTYGFYETLADIQGVRIRTVPLQPDFSLDSPAILEAVNEQTKLVLVCSPNNPTGNCMDASAIESLAQALKERCVVVVDEAYIEFAEQKSLASLTRAHSNLVVLRTLSKAWGLAGVRCGSAIGHPDLIAALQKVRAPYPLPTPTVELVLRATQEEGQARIKDRIQQLTAARRKLTAALREIPGVQKVYPSEANFLLVKTEDPSLILSQLKQAQVIIRDRSRMPGLEGCVRVTVGSNTDNTRLLSALQTGTETRK